MLFDYYKEQVDKLKDCEYQKSIKLFDGDGNQTKQIDLNLESIPVLQKFLTKELVRLQKGARK